jgi:sporulation protein YqfC
LDIYEEDEIRLDTACGQMQIVGHNLHLTGISPDSIAVGGRILAVCFLE